jgi:hypothetical protein
MRRSFRQTRNRTRLTLLASAAVVVAMALPAGGHAAISSSFFGISADGPSQHDFDRMQNSGFGSYRFGFSWRGAQSTPNGPIHWGPSDASVLNAAEHGMRPTPVMFGTPEFVSKREGHLVPPTKSDADLHQWQRFLAAAVRRYGPNGTFWQANPYTPQVPIHSWIIWNEENAKPYWSPEPDPRDYGKLVKASDDVISAIDSSARVVLGGIYGYPHDERSLTAVKFLKQLYRVKRIERSFDAVDLHPYGSGVATVRKQVKEARSVMRKAGDRSAEIIIGELGWASDGPKRSAPVVGAKGQKNRIRSSLQMLIHKRARWKISQAFVYVWRDFHHETSCNWCPFAGLVDFDGEDKPALPTLRKIIRDHTS